MTTRTPCNECPWRRDAPPGRFPPSRYAALERTCQQRMAPVFACHKTKEGSDRACVGYLLRDGDNNIRVRLWQLRTHHGDAAPHEQVARAALASPVKLYKSFYEMAEANGWRPPMVTVAQAQRTWASLAKVDTLEGYLRVLRTYAARTSLAIRWSLNEGIFTSVARRIREILSECNGQNERGPVEAELGLLLVFAMRSRDERAARGLCLRILHTSGDTLAWPRMLARHFRPLRRGPPPALTSAALPIIAPELRARVQALIAEHGLVPLARSLGVSYNLLQNVAEGGAVRAKTPERLRRVLAAWTPGAAPPQVSAPAAE